MSCLQEYNDIPIQRYTDPTVYRDKELGNLIINEIHFYNKISYYKYSSYTYDGV